MMEGRNPNAFCTLTSCARCSRQWIPSPPVVFPRRNPLVEAYALTENPCLPPGRCPPCKKPIPKFRMLREFDACDVNKFKKEKEAAQKAECRKKWHKYYESFLPQASLEVGVIDPDRAKSLAFQTEDPYTGCWKEMKPKTNILAGFFNPDDNKTDAERYRKRCDPAWIDCSPELAEYPCRGVINFPLMRWQSKEEQCRECFPADCNNKSPACSYLTPEYLYEFKKKKEKWAEEDRQKVLEQLEKEKKAHDEYMGCYACPCASGRCSETMQCYHPTKPTVVL